MLQATSRVHPQRNLKRSLVTFKDDYPHWSLPLFQVTLFYFYFFNLFFILFHYSPIDSNSIFSLIYAFKCLFIYIYIFSFTCLILSYLVENGHCFITLCDSSYPRKLAFHYLQDLQKEFEKFDIGLMEKITKPYSFVRFGNLQ